MNFISIGMALLLQTQLATVEGIVSKTGGSGPLSGAKVTLLPVNRERPEQLDQLVTLSEDDGKFTFPRVPPGSYTLSVTNSRYGAANYGQRRPGGPGATFSVNAAQRLSNINVSMAATGAIAGRINNRSGEPVVNATVQAHQFSYQGGKKILRGVQTTTTNDLGEYRLFQLPAGQYFVSATVSASPYGFLAPTRQGEIQLIVNTRMALTPDAVSFLIAAENGPAVTRILEDGTAQEEAWMPVFYPGTIESTQATPVSVSPDATMTGVNFTIAPAPVRKVSGRIIGPVSGVPSVSLVPQTPSFNLRNALVTPESATSFRFEIRGVSPGSYTLVVQMNRRVIRPTDGALLAASSLPEYFAAPLPIEVGDRDIDNLSVGLSPGIAVSGRVALEASSGAAPGPNALAGLTLSLSQGNTELPLVTFEPDPATGSFVVPSIGPGDYQIQVYGFGVYVKAARLGQLDVTNGLRINGAVQDRLEIVLTREAGSVEGDVTDMRRAPAAGATVVLVPAAARRNLSLYKSTVADASGHFRLDGIVAGDYVAFAWEDVDNGAWQDPDFLRPFESNGRPVRVTENAKQDLQMSVIPVP